MDNEASVQALLLTQEYRLRGLGELADLAKDHPQLIWHCSVCKVNRCHQMNVQPTEYQAACRLLPIVKCAYCKKSICSNCGFECRCCRTLLPGDFISQACSTCRHLYLVGDMCINCISYYSNEAENRYGLSSKERPFIQQAKTLKLSEEFQLQWKIIRSQRSTRSSIVNS